MRNPTEHVLPSHTQPTTRGQESVVGDVAERAVLKVTEQEVTVGRGGAQASRWPCAKCSKQRCRCTQHPAKGLGKLSLYNEQASASLLVSGFCGQAPSKLPECQDPYGGVQKCSPPTHHRAKDGPCPALGLLPGSRPSPDPAVPGLRKPRWPLDNSRLLSCC